MFVLRPIFFDFEGFPVVIVFLTSLRSTRGTVFTILSLCFTLVYASVRCELSSLEVVLYILY